MIYRATLCNSAGELDYIIADSMEVMQRHLAQRLTSKEWTLADGDTIIISTGDAHNIEEDQDND